MALSSSASVTSAGSAASEWKKSPSVWTSLPLSRSLVTLTRAATFGAGSEAMRLRCRSRTRTEEPGAGKGGVDGRR